MLCLHKQENKQIFTQLVAYQMKNTAREIKTDYLANHPCSMESFSQIETIVTQIEKQIESQSSFNKDSGGPKNKEQNF